MSATVHIDLEQAQTELPSIIANANAGIRTIITQHGKPCAAIVSWDEVQKSFIKAKQVSHFLALRGTGVGLWGYESDSKLARSQEWDVH